MEDALRSYIPSPPINSFHIGPLLIHFYALGYLIGIALAILITRRRWRALGGDPDVVNEVALWAVPAGIIGGRIYFDVTTPMDIPHVWYGAIAVWDGGLGIWGGIALATVVGGWRLRRLGISVGPFANAVAPALLVAQAVGRIGNYFNKELFGKPTSLPWGLEIPLTYRQSQLAPQYWNYTTFQPTFLYELIWDLALAAFLVWLGHRRLIKPWGLFALYVAGYSAFRIFEESVRIDSSSYILGLRLNMYVAIVLTLTGLVWFVLVQRHEGKPVAIASPGQDGQDGTNEADSAAATDAPAPDVPLAPLAVAGAASGDESSDGPGVSAVSEGASSPDDVGTA